MNLNLNFVGENGENVNKVEVNFEGFYIEFELC